MAARSFGTAEKVLGFLAVIGWLAVIAAAILSYIAYDVLGGMEAFVMGGSVALGGLVMIAVAQLGLAQIETARATAGILEHLRNSAGRGVAEGAATDAASRIRDVPLTRRKPAHVGGARSLVRVYKDVAIERTPEGIEADGEVYDSVDDAEAAIRRKRGES
ncbi:hypothetical protein [Roseovarius indicus]|uniref:hypothetical protein n=1 Tax=Roseovarius indicus TaxID=540747 RepID=UPI0032F09242